MDFRYAQHAVDVGRVEESPMGRVLVVLAERCQSLIGEMVRKRDITVDYVAIVNLHDQTVSLRSVDPGCNVAKVAQAYGGGGHAVSAGYEFDWPIIQAVIERVVL
jgi:nanoRNase/pAp phosphatase (c-di-AMP/oligoRNAs hydrolase)